MSTSALVVIDMQNAYFDAGDLEGKATSLVKAANELLDIATTNNIPIFNVITRHERDRSTWTLNMLDDQEGYLFDGDAGAEVVAGLKLAGADTVTKTRDSAFFQTLLVQRLKESSIDTLILLGVSTHSCIYQTASDAYAHNLRVLIAKDAVASHDMRWHDPALAMLEQEYRQSALGTDELRSLMQRAPTSSQ